MVDLALDSLALPSALDVVPVGRLVGLVSDAFWSLVGLAVVTAIEHVRVVYRQLSRLLLVKLPVLILIDLNLPPHIFKRLGIHLC